MADGSKPQENIRLSATENGGLTNKQFDALTLRVCKALALSDVLNEMANHNGGGESLHEDTLSTYSGMLYEVLHDAHAIIHGKIDARTATGRSEVAHG